MTYNKELYALVSNQVLENSEIALVFRDEPVDEKDSGWQLFAGDEEDDFMDDPANSSLMTLAQLLEMAPLLDAVFSNDDETVEAFEYDEESEIFVPLLLDEESE